MSFEKPSYKRILENGIRILDENITEDEDTVVFEFHLDRDVEMKDLLELSTPSPNAVIFDRLVKKGWIAGDGTTFMHFKMDVSQDKTNRKIKYKYYKVIKEPERVN